MPQLELVRAKAQMIKSLEEYYNSIRTNIQFSGRNLKVIALTSDIGLSTSDANKILVPAALLDAYKSASYWSNYASIMVGV